MGARGREERGKSVLAWVGADGGPGELVGWNDCGGDGGWLNIGFTTGSRGGVEEAGIRLRLRLRWTMGMGMMMRLGRYCM